MYYSYMYYMKVFIPVGEGGGRRKEEGGGGRCILVSPGF